MTNLNPKYMAELFERIACLLERAVPLLTALQTIESETAKPDKKLVSTLTGLIRAGDSLTQALERIECLPDDVLAQLRKSEMKGHLDRSLKDTAARMLTGLIQAAPPKHLDQLLEAATTQYHGVLKKVNRLMIHAAESRASDLHLEPAEDGGQIRLRIDGVLKEQPERPDAAEYRAMVGRIKEMAALDPAEHALPQDGRIKIRVSGQAPESGQDYRQLDVRVSICPFVFGEKVVMRFLDRSTFPQGFEHIRVSADKIATIRRWLASPFGMILVSGPTGSGKTTMLYLLLRELAERGTLNIISIEDPVEYILPGVYQMQINPAISLTFPAALRSVMRQDPDVISAGEIRTPETATLLAQAALTGHLTLSQLHARNAVATLRLMADMGVPDYTLREIVVGVISQRLVRRLCPACKTPVSDAERAMLPDVLQSFDGPIYKAVGCDACQHTGYLGRDVIMELFEPPSGFWDALKDDAYMPACRTLRDDAFDRVMEGVTSFAEISRVISL